jgi:hypothetical protein
LKDDTVTGRQDRETGDGETGDRRQEKEDETRETDETRDPVLPFSLSPLLPFFSLLLFSKPRFKTLEKIIDASV